MFRLTAEEWEGLGNSSQIVMSSETIDTQRDGMSSQIVMTSVGGIKRPKTYLPYAFTEHGVTMLASVLKSEKAVQMSIAVVRAFISLKELALKRNTIDAQFQEIRERLGEHDVQLNAIYDAIENLLDEKAAEKKWEDRPRIGFKSRTAER
jgi:signal recognition particle GTPase